MRSLVIAALIACSSGASSHDWDDEPGWEAWEDWRLLGHDSKLALFIGAAYTERAGNALTFETLLVRRDPDEYGQYQENRHYLVDCSTLTLQQTHIQPFDQSGKGGPPPLVRKEIGSLGHVPDPGTALHEAASQACAKVPLSPTKVADPSLWARTGLNREK